jgi:diguanylate cyclase (GGDEF)-like protein
MNSAAVTSRMGRRFVVVLCACAAVPLLVFAFVAARTANSFGFAAMDRGLTAVSQSNSRGLRSRLGAAETIVQTLTARDVGYDGSALKQQVVNSRAIRSVVVVDRDGLLAGGDAALRPTSAQLLSLEAGQTVLLTVALKGQLPAVFLARAVSAAGFERLAYFEIAPDWLWKDFTPDAQLPRIVVVDAEGRLLLNPQNLSPDTGKMFAENVTLDGERGAVTRVLGWQAGAEEWRGVLTHVPLVNEHITAVPWAVVAFDRQPTFTARARSIWTSVPYLLLLALACGFLAAAYLARRYAVPLKNLRLALPSLQQRQFERLPLHGGEEPRALIEAYNRCAASLEEQFYALETLGEIDQLLLGSADLEHVLDAILSRVQTVTRCQSVGITLRDADAPGRGRIYLAANGLTGLPVSRVELDDDMVTTLVGESGGLTVTRCEDTRHSFLRPMKEIGAEFFWVWPVIVSDRLEAILAVGYREAPVADPQVARCGGQFAERLAIALSKTARDARLYRQAHYDPLTALPNRLLFRDRLEQELTNASAGLSRGALLYIDLDHFKRVNDSVGHAAGDQLLTIVAQRLRAAVKDGDTVARLAGDEFTVILRNVTDPDAARAIADRINESLQMPVNIGGRDHNVSASIGITLFPDDAATIDELMRNADTAMYRAKDMGRGRVMFFDLAMTGKPGVPTETGLHRALRRREFSLFFQPQFSVADGQLTGLEALLRWQTPRDGLRHPAEFVPAAEESGLIVDIGGWVIDTACAQLAAWRDQGIAPPRLAINVSMQQLKHAEFVKHVRRALDKYSITPALLELELTESVFADDAAGAVLERLSQLGVHLALDDFGTGYSSLNYLRQYPIDTVKIDRTFLEEVPQNPASATLVETIVVMAHALGKRVVAEGVETVDQLDFLRERHCDVAQGFYLARPLATPAVTELLQARTIAARASTSSSEVREAG